MEAYERPKPKLLDRVKEGIVSKARETINTVKENRQTYSKAYRSAQLSAIKAKARADVAGKHGVTFNRSGRHAAVLPSARQPSMRDRIAGSDEDRAAYRKRLYG